MTARLRSLVLVLPLVLLSLFSASAVADAVVPHGDWPLLPRPVVVRGFDPPSSPWGSGHRGVDLLGRSGQQVHAAAAGTISFVGTIAGRGVVSVDHGEVRTTYEPVSSERSLGDRVQTGSVIGTLQLPGSHCFPRACLHWGLLRGSTYLDPLVLVGLGPVRLYPVDGPVGDPTPSGPGVRLSVGRAQAVGAHVGVDLGRRQ